MMPYALDRRDNDKQIKKKRGQDDNDRRRVLENTYPDKTVVLKL